MSPIPDSFFQSNREISAHEERWLADQIEGDPFGGGWASFREEFIATIDPGELAALCRRLLSQGTLGLPPSLETELLALALADGSQEPSEQVTRFLRQRGVPVDGNVQEGEDAPADTLVAPPVRWTLRGLLSSPITLSLDSPMVHAFVVKRGEQVVEVLVVGRGLGSVRRRIYDLGMLAALAAVRPTGEASAEQIAVYEAAAEEARRRGDSRAAEKAEWLAKVLLDYEPAEVVDGLIWVSREAVDPRTGVPIAVDGQQTENLSDAFTLLLEELKRLDQTSAMVQLHYLTPEQIAPLRAAVVSDKGKEGGRKRRLLYDTQHEEVDRPTVATPRPMRYFDSEMVSFDVPTRVFQSRRCQLVKGVLLESRAVRTEADATDRYNFCERKRRNHEQELNDYNQLSPQQKQEKHKEEHHYNAKTDFAVFTEYVLRDSVTRSGKWHWTQNVPKLLRSSTKWAERMDRVRNGVRAAREDGRLERLVVGYLLDLALRGLPASSGDAAFPELDEWVRRARPYLWCKWQQTLQQSGVDNPSEYATRRLVFLTRLRDNRWRACPYYLFVNTTSVLDAGGPVHRLVDRVDRIIESEPLGAEATDEARDRLEHSLSAGPDLIPVEGRAADMCTALRHDPRSSAERIVRFYLEQAHQSMPAGDAVDSTLGRTVHEATISAIGVGAFYGAMRHLVAYLEGAAAELPDFSLPANCLPEVLLHFIYLRSLVDPEQIEGWDLVARWHKAWQNADDALDVPARVRQAFGLAEQWQPGYIAECLAPANEKNRFLPSKNSKIAKAERTSPGAVASLLEQGRDALDAAAALRAVQFPRRRCTARQMYRILGDPLAKVMASTGGLRFYSEVQELSSLLLGAEHYLNEKPQSGDQGGTL